MTRKRGIMAARRFTAVGALLLQLLAATLVPLASAAHEAAAADPRTHIEEAGGSPTCPRRHDDHQCITCRLATTAFLLTQECQRVGFETSIHPTDPGAVIFFLPRLLQTSPPSSRAPPVV
jgi:hypothetical protein